MSLQQLLDELLSEPLDRVEARSAAAFDSIAAPFERRIVVFGTGYLGRLTLRGLRTAGIEPLAFCDNNPKLRNTSVEGVPVLSPAAAASRFQDSAAFVVSIYNSTPPQDQLRRLGCTRVVPYPVLFWKHWRSMPMEDRLELPHRILARAGEMAAGHDLLSDEQSRREFCAQIRWRCLLDYSCLPKPDDASGMYFPAGLVNFLPQEVFVDCGAFDGDSARSFLANANGRFGHIYAFEADSDNVASLNRWRAEMPDGVAARITIVPHAVAGYDGVVSFCAEGYEGSKMVGAGGLTVPCIRLDTALAEKRPTFIKMDIEGAEPDALSGAAGIMDRYRPVMAVCAYHKCDHLWTLPRILKAANPDYQIFLRRYAEDCWETVYYAVPSERLKSQTVVSHTPG